MIKINLLPPEIHVAEVRKQLSVLGGIVAGIIVLVMMSFWLVRHLKANKLETQLVQANEELTKYQAIVDRVNQLEQTRNQLRSRWDAIQRLMQGRLTYPKFLEDFVANLPADIWITNMSTTMDDSGQLNVTISATSLSNFAIADWMTNLQQSSYFQNIELGTITSVEAGEGIAPNLTFTIQFRYVRRGA